MLVVRPLELKQSQAELLDRLEAPYPQDVFLPRGAAGLQEGLPLDGLAPEFDDPAPSTLDRVIKKCVAKDPDERWHSAHDLHDELTWIVEGGAQQAAPVVQPATRRQALPLAVAASVIVGILTGLSVWSLMRPALAPPNRWTMLVPEGVLELSDPMLSPDGRTIAFDGVSDGQRQVYVRRLDQLDAVPVQGAEGAFLAGFSPDGEWLLFSTSQQPGMLKRVPLTGGPAITIAEGFGSEGADWGPDDTIVQGSPQGLWAVPPLSHCHTAPPL